VVGSEDVFAMYTIERLADQGWTKEITCNTEFKAFINARTKCMATGRIYRVINSCRQVECVITLDDCKRQFQAR
jgi:pyrroloquinoline quinone (PQQ) biosynthesis protein C